MTETMTIDELALDAIRTRCRDTLGDRPESIPCVNNSTHPERQVDVGLLHQGGIRYMPCEACELEAKWTRSGIPARLLSATVAGYLVATAEQRELVDTVTRWIKGHCKMGLHSRTFLVLCGRPGTGKSHLAAAALKARGGGWFTSPGEIFRMKGARMDDKREPDPITKAKGARLLVLDEFCIGGDRKDAPEIWQEILDHRHQQNNPTVIASNGNLRQILDVIALPGMTDRLRADSEVCILDWESHR